MRKLSAITIIFLLFNVSVASCTEFPRHVDPMLLSLENPAAEPLFQLYGIVYASISSRDYSGARELIVSVNEILASSAAQKTLREYNGLLGRVVDELNVTEINLNEAREHLEWLRETLAGQVLDETVPHLESANRSTTSLSLASITMASTFSGSPPRLQEGVERVVKLIGDLEAELLEAYAEVEKIKALKNDEIEETFLNIDVDNMSPLVGTVAVVTGELSTVDGHGLSGKTVRLLVEGGEQVEFMTDEVGAFQYGYKVPYKYAKSLWMSAQYRPTGDEALAYLPSQSDQLILNPQYYTPVISLSAPNVVYPGKSFQVSGTVQHLLLTLRGWELTVQYFGQHSVVTDDRGHFSLSLTTPAEADDGARNIQVRSAPNLEYGPAAVDRSVQVIHLPLEIELKPETFYVAGRDAVFAGTVTSEGDPLPECSVRLELGEKIFMAVSDAGGRFTVDVPLELTALTSKHIILVTAIPVESWISTTSASASFYVVNVVTLAVFLVAFVAVSYNRLRRRMEETVTVQAPPLLPLPVVYLDLPGVSGLYVKAVRIVGRIANVFLQPGNTIREYLEKVKPWINDRVYWAFKRVSELYERWVYGPGDADSSEEAISESVEELEKFEQDQA